ncbi:MAG: hypothetical protein HWE07_14340 [Cytophagia bacterium]|nr:hypothetical protein [Cytophagia bacterium]
MIKRLVKSEFIRDSSWSFLAVAFKSLGGVIVSKLFSVYFGAAGLAILSHFQNLIGFFTSFANEGINKSIVKYWSDKKLKLNEKKRLFKTALWLTGVMMFVVLLPLTWWFRQYFFGVFVSNGSDAQFIWLFVLGVTSLTFAWCINSLILVECGVKDYAIINILSLLVLVGAVFLGIHSRSLNIALTSFILGNGGMFIFSLFYLILKRRNLIRSFVGWPDRVALSRISSFLTMAISVLLTGQILDFIVRDFIINSYGLTTTGEWQAVVKMSANFLLLFTNVVGVVYYPKVSTLIYDHGALKKYVLKVMILVSSLSLLSLTIYYLERGVFLELFFDKELGDAAYLVRYQAIGDFFALNSFLLATVLVAKVQIKKFVIGRFLAALVFLVTLALAIKVLNVEALTLGYMLRQIGLFILMVYFNKELLFGRSKSDHKFSDSESSSTH